MNESSPITAPLHADTGLDVVTGAFSYSGSSIASRLVSSGRRVRTLTGHPERAPHGTPIEIVPFDFDHADSLTRHLEGVTTLYNTYWVRFARDGLNHKRATRNSAALFAAAANAGVQRVVHISITNPSESSPFPYYRGKARTERALIDSGLPHSILRPAILFGGNGILINNIAYFLRRLPVFGVGGSGKYRIRGIHVDDLSSLAITQSRASQNSVIDAVGPERPTFVELVHLIKRAINSRALVMPVPSFFMPIATGVIGRIMGDVLLTKDEYHAMAAGLADSDAATTGTTRMSTWIDEHSQELGKSYMHEVKLHFDQN